MKKEKQMSNTRTVRVRREEAELIKEMSDFYGVSSSLVIRLIFIAYKKVAKDKSNFLMRQMKEVKNG